MSLENRKNIALIGAGKWGKNLARNFYHLGALHTLCDTNELLLDQYEKTYPGTHVTTNFHNVLSHPSISRVVIALPAIQHYKCVKEALLAGKDVYVEKPLCLDSVEAEELVNMAEKKGRILMVGHLLHYHPYVQRLQEIVASNAIGDLQYVVSNRLDLGPVRKEESALWNYAPHDVSVILSLCGHQLPQQIRCMGSVSVSPGIQDNALLTLRFESGIRAHIYVSWLNPFKEQKLVVVGKKGMLVFDDTKPWKEKLTLTPINVGWSKEQVPHLESSGAEKVVVSQEEPLRAECIHFIQCCNERKTPKTDGREGLRVIQVLNAAQASMEEDGIAKNPCMGVGASPSFAM